MYSSFKCRQLFSFNLNIRISGLLSGNIFILDTPVLSKYWAHFDISRQVTFHFYLTIVIIIEKNRHFLSVFDIDGTLTFNYELCVSGKQVHVNIMYVDTSERLRNL